MKLQGRNLKPNTRGDDVRLLQSELRQLGFDVVDTDGFFDSTLFLAVQAFQRQHRIDPADGIVDKETARLINEAVDELDVETRVVLGEVLREDGSPVAGASVQAFIKGLRQDTLLGEDRTGRDGRYEIRYAPEEERFSLTVRADVGEGAEPVASELVPNPEPVQVVNLVVGGALRGPSEFVQLVRRLEPILEREQVQPADLEAEDVELLARAHSLNPEHVAYFAISARMAREADMTADVFYALVRQGMPTVLIALVAQPSAVLRRAIEESVRENIVGTRIDEEIIGQTLRDLRHQSVRLSLREPEPDRATFGTLAEISGLTRERGERIVTDYLEHDGTPAEFWQRLREDDGVDDEEIESLQYTVGAAAVALNHQPLVRELTRMRHAGEIGPHISDLADLTGGDWQALIEREVDGEPVGAPAVLGDDAELRTARYAEFLPRLVETIFPTATMKRGLAEIDADTFAPTLRFLEANSEFEFSTTRLGDYLAEHPDALDGADDRDAILHQLKGVQRMFDISPQHDRAKGVALLRRDERYSATKIRRMGAPQFIRTHTPELGSVEAAQQMYSKAARRADTALFVASQSALFNPTQLTITAPHLLGEGVPGLEDLFGSLDLCQCEHCNSVYSPAAYLVDILHFLMNRPAMTPSRTALDVLFDRRPDLGDLELTCHNTNTVLPYVDLVNEVLENFVAEGEVAAFQTEGEADILGASPEHLNEAAYNTLAGAVYPWSLPFDLWAEEVRRYLEQLGVPRHMLMEHFRREGDAPLPIDVAAEYLGLTPKEREIVTGAAAEPTSALWGMDAAGFNSLLSGRRAATVLDRSGLSYEELTALLAVRLVNQGGGMRVQFDGADCDLDRAVIVGLGTAGLDRMHRFVRLQRKVGWPIHELAQTLAVLDVSDLDDDALLDLARVKRLRDDWRTPLETMLSWWSDLLDTEGHGNELSLYARVFRDPTINRPELEPFNLIGNQLAGEGQPIGDHATVVHAALAVSASDLELLVAAELPDDRLNLANLTRLYQAASLMKALKLTADDYLALRALTGIEPFGAGEVAATGRFVEQVRLVRESGFSIALLDYLLRHQVASSDLWNDARTSEFLGKLRAALREISADHAFVAGADPTGEQTAAKLALLLPDEVVNRAVALIADSPAEDEDSVAEDQADRIALIEEHFAAFLDPAEAVEQLVDPGTLIVPTDRFDFVLKPLLAHLRRVTSERLVVESLAGVLDIDAGVADSLVRELVPAPHNPAQTLLATFLDADFVSVPDESEEEAETSPSPEEFPNQFAAFHRLAKIGVLVNALDVPAGQVAFLINRGAELGWLDPVALPLEATDPDEALFQAWTKTVAIFRAARDLPDGITALFDLILALDDPELTRDAFLDLLAGRSGWKLGDLDFFTGAGGIALQFPADFTDGRFVVRLKRCFELLEPLGVAAAAAWSWAVPDLDEAEPDLNAATARAIKQAVRARFDDQQQWLAAAGPIRDDLREQQRAALVAYLVHEIAVEIPQFATPHPELSQGMRGRAVQELQLKLNAAGTGPRLKVDGIFGRSTLGAVAQFQAFSGLPVLPGIGPDGVGPAVRLPTWAALDEVRGRLSGPSDLYAHFLIDVEMDPCMLTSRLVQATNAVQLFVQRCLLNLEPEVELTPADAKEWEWMKNYRVWEANRKVFLYPENWIEPELRDDKTPFFTDLEQGLLQDEVNDATAEREYLKYLRSLDHVAQLEISGLYRQWETDRDILHVIGRTRSAPHVYYYRQWVDGRYWTAWERVEADIEGDHLVPVIYNRRLYLFWPMFMEKAEEEIIDNAARPRRFYEVRLAWSEYRDRSWSPKQMSTDFVTIPEEGSAAFTSFWTQLDEDRLYILGEWHTSEGFQPIQRQFRLSQCHGAMEVNAWQLNRWVPFSPTPLKLMDPFPGTEFYYNALRERTGAQNLTVITSGQTIGGSSGVQGTPGFELLDPDTTTSADLLFRTPGRFSVVLPQAERPSISRSPFFYQDDARTFFVVPNGRYTSGSGGSVVDDLMIELQPAHAVPLELPDIVTNLAANAVSRDSRRAAVVDTGGVPVEDLSTPASSDLLTINAGVARALAKMFSPGGVTTHSALPKHWEARFFRFENFYHPYVCLLIEQLNRHCIDGVLRPDPEKEPFARRETVAELRRQLKRAVFFGEDYEPNDKNVVNVYKISEDEKEDAGPLEEFDFAYGGAYSIYNWELFFHAPFMVAKRLSANRRFAEARRWFHYIFDPTYSPEAEQTFDEPWPERVWQIKPFFEHGVGMSIQRTMLLLKSSGLSRKELDERKQLRNQIDAWRENPFNPHLIARMREEAYMKTVVMAYLDNLIAWGDHLFRQDTRESINEATQIYMLAAEILGERPHEIPAHEGARRTIDGEEVSTFNQLKGRLDDFSNVLVELETTLYPMDTGTGGEGSIGSIIASTDIALDTGNDDGGFAPGLPLAAPDVEPPDDGGVVLDLPEAAPIPAILGPTLFFCIPKNDQLLDYWDTVEDRLFKIRHCMNIEGVERQLALFQPPIDPGLLVKAAAAGLDIGSVLSDLNAPPPHYRFQTWAQTANAFLNDVKSLGGALLSALEKKDAEELAVLRSTHEIQLLEAIRHLKEASVQEAQENKRALEETRKVTDARQKYYSSRARTNAKEDLHLKKLEAAHIAQLASQSFELVGAVLAGVPNFDIGVEGISSPTVKASWGGAQLAASMGAYARVASLFSSVYGHQAAKAAIEGGYDRRKDDWDHQADLAEKELLQIDKQVDAADIRIAIAEQDVQNHELQITNAKATDEYMRSKYTNQELYSWMISQIAAVYFQSYQQAYDIAKRAERAFQHELGVTDTDFISFGYWDGLKKGLLAGERLQYDLHRMEAAYLNQNRRELEITKHVSLALLDPVALLQLKEQGNCEVNLPEMLFDLDFPGHYMRRIKSVSVTIPCVTGPYTSVSGTLTLLKHSVRAAPNLNDPVQETFGAIQSIATSSAQNDSGLFELNFRDERYLPFEGAGAISMWRLELPAPFPQFDYETISDVVFHINYTARDGGAALRDAATTALREGINEIVRGGGREGWFRLFSARHEFPTQWHRFLHPPEDAAAQTLSVQLSAELFPFIFRNPDLEVDRVELILQLAEGTESIAGSGTRISLVRPGGTAEFELQPSEALGGLLHAIPEDPQPTGGLGDWSLEVTNIPDGLQVDGGNRLNPEAIADIGIICHYNVP